MGGGLNWVTGKTDEISNEVLGYNVGYLLNYPLGSSPFIFEQGLRYKTRGSLQEDFYTVPGIRPEKNPQTGILEDVPVLDQVLYDINETMHYLDVLVRLKLDLSSEYGLSFQPFVGIAPSMLLFSDAIEHESTFIKVHQNGKEKTEISKKNKKNKDMRDLRSNTNIVLLSGIDIQINRSLTLGIEFDFGLSNINKVISKEDGETNATSSNAETQTNNEAIEQPGPTLMTGRMTTRSMMINIGYKFDF